MGWQEWTTAVIVGTAVFYLVRRWIGPRTCHCAGRSGCGVGSHEAGFVDAEVLARSSFQNSSAYEAPSPDRYPSDA